MAGLLLVAFVFACSDSNIPATSPNAILRVVSPTTTPAITPEPVIPPLTLDGIFPPRDLAPLKLDSSRLRTLIATGDVIPARYSDRAIRLQGDDFLYPVAYTADILRAADLTVINLEAPLLQSCPLPQEYSFTFCGRPGFIQALLAGGVDIATLENNHITNYGPQGVAETVDLLEANGIAWADRQQLAVREVRGLRFGFLAFNGVGEAIDRTSMAGQIQSARPQVDVLAVAFHWGAEYVSLPQPAPGIAPDDPAEIAHLAVDSGADLVIGNHPHWVQAVELYQGKFIAYAHGNFIFDQMWSYETRVGVIGRYIFYDRTLVKVEFIPVLSHDYAQPRLLEGEERQAVLDGMREASQQLAGP
ncbi:MAG TPA: CapA family protein [Dehalococcoidia bacterium]|nr:CapA family protein [Dehalococcoidia bacterium]